MSAIEFWEQHRLDILTSLSILWGFAWGYIVKAEMVRIDRLAGYRLTVKRRKPGKHDGRMNASSAGKSTTDFTIPLMRKKGRGKRES